MRKNEKSKRRVIKSIGWEDRLRMSASLWCTACFLVFCIIEMEKYILRCFFFFFFKAKFSLCVLADILFCPELSSVMEMHFWHSWSFCITGDFTHTGNGGNISTDLVSFEMWQRCVNLMGARLRIQSFSHHSPGQPVCGMHTDVTSFALCVSPFWQTSLLLLDRKMENHGAT